ncbi:DUF3084 domain-containing protein [bacterium]|nr:DUF3084 domain-containing protein [bacterium]
MNNLDWTLVVFLIVISGVIAFVGNYVGRRAGKRRVSILGLRPYYTSMIITVLTGITITAVTLIILVSVSSSMRSALENKAQLQETVRLLSQRLSTTQSELSIRASELNAAIEYQKKLEENIKEQSKKVKQLEKQIKEMEFDLKNKERALEENRAHLKELERQRERLTNTIAELSRDREKLKKEADLLKEEREKLLEESKQLKDRLGKLEKDVSELEKQRQILNSKLELYNLELSELKKEVDNYKIQAVELKKEIKFKEEQLNLLRHQKILFHGGETIIAETINGPKSEQEARDSLGYLLDRANEIVRSRYVQLGLSPPDKDAIITYDSDDLGFAIRSLKEEQRLIRIKIKNNTFIREPAQLTIESLKSKLIFNKDETITFRFISSKLPRNKIIEELDLLLTEAVKEGIRRGMIIDHLTNPIANVSYETLLSLSVRIKVKYSKVDSALVLVKAEREIYTGGPLRVRFEVR